MITDSDDYPPAPPDGNEEDQDIDNDGYVDTYIVDDVENGWDDESVEEIEWVSMPLEEIIDEKNFLERAPPVPREKYPTPAEFLSFFKDSDQNFQMRRGFIRPHCVNDVYYYHIPVPYVKKLVKWINNGEEGNGNFLAIDNSSAFDTDPHAGLKSYQVLTEASWKQLLAWFGGGVALKTRCCFDNHISSRGVSVHVISQKENNKYRLFYFSPYETVEFAKIIICNAFDVEPSECRLHDFFNYLPYFRLDGELTKDLDDMKLATNNPIFIEFPDDTGKFTVPEKGIKPTVKNKISGEKGPEGIVGLDNLGNTCYMNSMLQCLSNIPMLKESFVSKEYVKDINMDNVLGYQGHVANAFSSLLRKMWSGNGSVVRPSKFKKIITKAKPDFAGIEQHDSQEFLSQLLDAMHEDINRIKKKPPTDKVEANGRPDMLVAEESLQTYKSRNDSVIADLFLGLYKSTVTCPAETCTNVSVTFDPYMIIPLPLQTEESYYQVLQIVYVSRNPKTPVRRMRIIAPKHGPGFILKEILREKLGINKRNWEDMNSKNKQKVDKEVVAAQGYPDYDEAVVGQRDLLLFNSRRSKLSSYFFGDTEPLSNFSESSVVVCFECFNTQGFENFCFVPNSYWKRKLQTSRAQPRRGAALRNYRSPELAYDGDISDSEYEELPNDHRSKKVIGFLNCPFTQGDLWYGNYNFKELPQEIRLEITSVERMEWNHYAEYKREIVLLHGDLGHPDTTVTEETFGEHEVYEIVGVADTKVQADEPVDVTAAEVRGVYICSKKPKLKKKGSKNGSENQRSKRETKKTKSKREKNSSKGLFNYRSKRNNRTEKESGASSGSKNKRSDKKDKKAEEKQEENSNSENLHKVSRKMKANTLEAKHTHGVFVLRPTEKRKLFQARRRHMQGYGLIEEDPDEREPIVLMGKIDCSFKYGWGKFQVDQGFTKGEFTLKIFETSNWNHRCGKSKAINKENEILNFTRYPLPSNRDNRLLIMLCHRELKRFNGVPEVFFLPNAISEADALEVISHRLAIYFRDEGVDIKNPENGDEEDPLVTFLENIRIMRADYTFNHQARRGDDQGTGEYLEPSADSPLKLGEDYVIRLLAVWPDGYPFEKVRPSKCLNVLQSDEEKMTLDKALTLFQKTDKLSAMNAWYCNKCKAHQEAFKQLQIWSLPKVLVIQFKRFSQDEGRSTADKLEIPVDFPFSLDLKDITLSSHVVEEAGKSMSADINKSNNFLSSYNYELVAVSSHVGGGLGFGHYIACAKNENTGKWYEFNDDLVTEIGEDFSRIVNPQAYVLFYVNSEYSKSKVGEKVEQKKTE